MEQQKPAGFENYLTAFGPVMFDGNCGEPVAWGFKIVIRLDEETFNALRQYGQLECVDSFKGLWTLIAKKLNRKDAQNIYGEITDEVFGPRGGWKSTTFGNKRFISKFLKPENKK